LRDGELWFTEIELCALLRISPAHIAGLLGDAGMGERSQWINLRDRDVFPVISEYGFLLLFHAPAWPDEGDAGQAARRFHRWAVKTLLPAARRAAAQLAAARGPFYGLEDPLYVAATDLIQRLNHKYGRGQTVFQSQARLFTCLLRNHGDGEWAKMRIRVLSRDLAVSAASLIRALDRLCEWDFVERDPPADPATPCKWPRRLRLKHAAIESALAEFGIELPAPSNAFQPI
jgi:hypothetical protein